MRVVSSVLFPFEIKRVGEKHKLLHSAGFAGFAEAQASRKYQYYYDSKINGLSDENEIHFYGFVNAPAEGLCEKRKLLKDISQQTILSAALSYCDYQRKRRMNAREDGNCCRGRNLKRIDR